MKTSQNQISLFTEIELISLQEGFLVNHLAQQEKEKAQKMTAISGRKCLEQFERFNHAGSWAKMLVDYLVGQKDWYSSRSKLIWKMKGTKSYRYYFQLAVLTHPTKEKESFLLPTPVSSDAGVGAVIGKADKFVMTSNGTPRKINQNGTNGSVGLARLGKLGFLPTPVAFDCKKQRKLTKGKNLSKKGTKYGIRLGQLAESGFLPTPTTMDYKGGGTLEYVERRNSPNLRDLAPNSLLPSPMASDCGTKATGLENQDSLTKRARSITGKTSQLNPQFVAEMMGFPPNWTQLPFQTGKEKEL